MTLLLNWIKRARWRESLSHCFEGLLIFFPAALIARSWWMAALCVVVWYWSRKKVECETTGDHVDSWSKGWFPWQWSGYQMLDVALPAITSCLLAWAFARYGSAIPGL